MQSTPDVDIIGAQQSHVVGMANIVLRSFDMNEAVKHMYGRNEVWPVIIDILREYVDDNQVQFILAVARDSGLIIGWMSFGIMASDGPLPRSALNQMTSWIAQRILRANKNDPRYFLAGLLEDRSREGQDRYMPHLRLVISNIFTDPDHRRRGVASTLLKRAIEHAKSINVSVWVQTQPANGDLFRRNGFHDVDHFSVEPDVFNRVATSDFRLQLGVQTWRQLKLKNSTEAILDSITGGIESAFVDA